MPGPSERQNLLFSATLSHRVLELAYEHMNEPEKLVVEAETVTAARVRQACGDERRYQGCQRCVLRLRKGAAPLRSLPDAAQTVFPMDKLQADAYVFHKTCLKVRPLRSPE